MESAIGNRGLQGNTATMNNRHMSAIWPDGFAGNGHDMLEALSRCLDDKEDGTFGQPSGVDQV
jgi:hypothetical protein